MTVPFLSPDTLAEVRRLCALRRSEWSQPAYAHSEIGEARRREIQAVIDILDSLAADATYHRMDAEEALGIRRERP